MKCLSFEMENLIHINVGDFLHVEKLCRRCVEKPCCIYVTRFL